LIGLLAVSPLSSSMLFDRGIPLPANLVTLFSLVNSLILERYFYRGMMTIGYIIQYHSKVMAAIPVALQIIDEAIDRVVTALFTLPADIYFYSRMIAIKAEDNLKLNSQKCLSASREEIGGVVQNSLLKAQVTDDFFWHAQTQY
jgi:hypothetical protein